MQSPKQCLEVLQHARLGNDGIVLQSHGIRRILRMVYGVIAYSATLRMESSNRTDDSEHKTQQERIPRMFDIFHFFGVSLLMLMALTFCTCTCTYFPTTLSSFFKYSPSMSFKPQEPLGNLRLS